MLWHWRLTYNWYNRTIYIGTARLMIFGWFCWMPNIIISAKTFKSCVTISREGSSALFLATFFLQSPLASSRYVSEFCCTLISAAQAIHNKNSTLHYLKLWFAFVLWFYRSWYYYPCESEECFFINFFVISKSDYLITWRSSNETLSVCFVCACKCWHALPNSEHTHTHKRNSQQRTLYAIYIYKA